MRIRVRVSGEWPAAPLTALHAAREVLTQEGRTSSSVIGVRGMIWMPG